MTGTHTPPFMHTVSEHPGKMFVPHVGPTRLCRHVHWKLLIPSVHVPPFWHGPDAHSFTFTAHVDPAYPGAHAHANALNRS